MHAQSMPLYIDSHLVFHLSARSLTLNPKQQSKQKMPTGKQLARVKRAKQHLSARMMNESDKNSWHARLS